MPLLCMEAGVAWLSFVMPRLDMTYRMRVSESPLLTRRPSEYIREFFFTTQPLELSSDPRFLKMFVDACDGGDHLLYASDYPHQDFDLPSVITDLPFLSDDEHRNILGLNAMRLFGLENLKLQDRLAVRANQ